MQIFDFSERKQSNQAATLVPARRFGGSPNAEVLVTPHASLALPRPFTVGTTIIGVLYAMT